MKVNITMIARDRQKLTEQALASLAAYTPGAISTNLTVLDDGSDPRYLFEGRIGESVFHANLQPTGSCGAARNQVIALAQKLRPRGDLLYLSDNDVFFQSHWLDALLDVWPFAVSLGFKVLGACCHPYMATPVRSWPVYVAPLGKMGELREVLALPTQSWLLSWETWDRYGPFDANPGVRQSEDVAFGNKVRADGGKVGYLRPQMVISTSRTDTFGQLIPGHELVHDIEGILIE